MSSSLPFSLLAPARRWLRHNWVIPNVACVPFLPGKHRIDSIVERPIAEIHLVALAFNRVSAHYPAFDRRAVSKMEVHPCRERQANACSPGALHVKGTHDGLHVLGVRDLHLAVVAPKPRTLRIEPAVFHGN